MKNAKDMSHEELLAAYEFLEELVAKLPGHIYWLDTECRYLGCNDEQAKSAGLESRHDIVGKRNEDLPWNQNAGDLAHELDKINQAVMEEGRPITIEEIGYYENGTDKKVFLSIKYPLSIKAHVNGMLGMSVDITKQVTNRAKVDIQQNLAHTLKTPLNSIVGCFECIKMMCPDKPDVLQMCKDGIEAAKEIVAITDRMIGYAKVEAGDIPIRQEAFNLRELLEPAIKHYSKKVHDKNIDLHYSYPTDMPNMLISDSDRILIIVKQLVDNAVKFTTEGSVTLLIDIRRTEDNKANFHIEVRDTGRGIPVEHQAYIFERYTRIEPSYKGLHEGEGLGLTIVKQFVNDLEGKISLMSKENETTIISVTLPVMLQNEIAAVQTAWDELYPDVSMLIIDDNVGGEIVERQMASRQVHAMTVERALNHLLLADGQTFDMILIDDSPQDYDLLSLCRLLKKLPTVQDSMLLLLTQPATASTVTRWKQIGIYDYIVKPYTPSEFLDKLADCWQRFTN